MLLNRGVVYSLVLLFIGLVSCDYDVPTPQVAFYAGGGFEVSIPADPKISLFAFHGKKNMELDGTESGTWNTDITKATGNRFVFVEKNAKFNLGDRLNFWLYVVHDGLGYELLFQMKEVKSFRPRPHGLEKTGYEFAQPRIRFLNPRGFEVSLPAEEGMTLMAFHGQLNEPFTGRTGGTFSQDITRPKDGFYTFKDQRTKLKRGDNMFFWIYVIFKGLGYHLEDQVYNYRGDEIENHNIHFVDSTEETATPLIDVRDDSTNDSRRCRLSISLVNGKREFCTGAEIFFEDFTDSSLSPQKWKIERRIAGEPDYEFVIYSNDSIRTGPTGLRITPQLKTNRRELRKNIEVADCTAPRGTPQCKFDNALTGEIAPPVISSQISTEGKFSFLYGRVEIEARLPRGAWIMPQIWLQPQGFKYDKADYMAGQVRIAAIENNFNGIVGVKQGVVLCSQEPCRSQYLVTRSLSDLGARWDKEFHKFTVEWKPEGLSFWIDGQRNVIGNWKASAESIPGSSSWKDNDGAAPFDQEFFLTLGVGVGGSNDFVSDDLPWDRTSPQQRREFLQSSTSWLSSWTDVSKSLEVKSMKIYAL